MKEDELDVELLANAVAVIGEQANGVPDQRVLSLFGRPRDDHVVPTTIVDSLVWREILKILERKIN
jgi:hypothetical protein